MIKDRIRTSSEPLRALGEALGVAESTWKDREELSRLNLPLLTLEASMAHGLDVSVLETAIKAYGPALTLRFRVEEDVVLDAGTGVDEAAMSSFRDAIKDAITVTVDLRLDKAKLLEQETGVVPGCQVYLYFFSESFLRLLHSDLTQLERQLWAGCQDERIVVVLADREILASGPYFAVIGSQQVEADWDLVTDVTGLDMRAATAMYGACRESVIWQDSWVEQLTPLHLALSLEHLDSDQDDVVMALLLRQAELALLYTADRSVRSGNGQWTVYYSGPDQVVNVETAAHLAEPLQTASNGIAVLSQIARWAYEDQWSSDRLPLVQSRIATHLRLVEKADRFETLIRTAVGLWAELQWHWKAILEGKIEAYIGQVQELEGYVDDTTADYTDQISAMIDSLSKAMLAAVAVIIGSFVAALFTSKFNPRVFFIGITAYSMYLLLFPLGYNMLNLWKRYKKVTSEVIERRKRFEQRLFPEKVEEIVGTRISDSQTRFRVWFWSTVAAYVVVAIAILVGAGLIVGPLSTHIFPASGK